VVLICYLWKLINQKKVGLLVFLWEPGPAQPMHARERDTTRGRVNLLSRLVISSLYVRTRPEKQLWYICAFHFVLNEEEEGIERRCHS
jgi:hypothetical protein